MRRRRWAGHNTRTSGHGAAAAVAPYITLASFSTKVSSSNTAPRPPSKRGLSSMDSTTVRAADSAKGGLGRAFSARFAPWW